MARRLRETALSCKGWEDKVVFWQRRRLRDGVKRPVEQHSELVQKGKYAPVFNCPAVCQVELAENAVSMHAASLQQHIDLVAVDCKFCFEYVQYMSCCTVICSHGVSATGTTDMSISDHLRSRIPELGV